MKYKVIICDAPWGSYSNAGFNFSARQQYPTMKVKELCTLRVSEIADNDAVLLMWATWPLFKEAITVVEAWGFNYVTGMPWIKIDKAEEDLWGDWHFKSQTGVGFWVRGVSEPILICKRGNVKWPKDCWVGLLSPNIGHSRKPDNLYEYAESMPGPYLEMFARRPRSGWSTFGNEVNSDVKLI